MAFSFFSYLPRDVMREEFTTFLLCNQKVVEKNISYYDLLFLYTILLAIVV